MLNFPRYNITISSFYKTSEYALIKLLLFSWSRIQPKTLMSKYLRFSMSKCIVQYKNFLAWKFQPQHVNKHQHFWLL